MSCEKYFEMEWWYGLVALELQTIAVEVVTKNCILLLQNHWEGKAFFNNFVIWELVSSDNHHQEHQN